MPKSIPEPLQVTLHPERESITMKFRAAVLHEFHKPAAIDEVALSPLRDHDVLVRVRATSLCHTDFEVTQGLLERPVPTILGHEAAGTVERVGAAVASVRAGDHVVCSWNPSCGHCYYCERQQPILCEPVNRNIPRGRLLDGTTRLTLDGEPLNHFMMISSHAEYCLVPEAGAVKVTDDIPFDRACLIGCAVMTGYGAATNIAPVAPGSSVVVVGCGGVGLNVVQAAALRGAQRVIAIDRTESKLQTARTFGATDMIDAARIDALAAVREMTRGRGADYVFEAAGHPDAMQLALEAARPGGEVVLLGKVAANQQVAFRWGSLMGEKRITRSSYGGARPHRDFPALAQAYVEGRLKLDELISRRIRLDGINEGYAALAAGAALRTVVTFDA
jgi:S-(hydroxymethyl)glutathione dehydrogenase / alcohol dehydrogenase